MFRLASAKVRRGFELAKLSGNIFAKILLTGRFWRVGVAIRGDKRGPEGRERTGGAPWAGGGPRSGTSGNGGEGRKTEGRGDGRGSEGRKRAGPEAELRGTVVKGGTRRAGLHGPDRGGRETTRHLG